MNESFFKFLKYTYTFISVCMPILLAATGVLGIQFVNQNPLNDSTVNTQIVFMGIYLIVFAAVLFSYEVIQLLPVEFLDNQFKRNFGFLYGPIGKGCFTLM